MPPRKGAGRGIVKSGNAGNAKLSPRVSVPVKAEQDKPLFPLGSKYPLSLLNERCQKNGWEKPEVNTRHHPDGHRFLVVLRRLNKKTSLLESVQLEPHPPFLMPSALEARHWGATYALYRICNNIQLNRILPPGPREYWAQLEREHKAAPEHLKWMYSPDPFAAQKEVEARQSASSKRREMSSSDSRKDNSGTVGTDVVGAIEVKMSGDLRELVESAAYDSRQPPAGQSSPVFTNLPTESHDSISVSLRHLLFTPPQIARTLKALSIPSPLTTSLLASSPTPLDAAISHLLLCVPECDLPPRFLARGAGESFVQSTHKGTEDLNSRWFLERAVKEAGYPENVVRSVLFPAAVSGTGAPLMMDWATLLASLGQRLVLGEDTVGEMLGSDFDVEERDIQRASEFAALESVYPSATLVEGSSQTPNTSIDVPDPVMYFNVPIRNSPLTLHMVLPAWHAYPLSASSPPMYVSSNSTAVSAGASSGTAVPPYVRLHLLATILSSPIVKGRDSGEGIGLIAAGIIEEEWEKIQAQGPPDASDVLRHLVRPATALSDPPLGPGQAHEPISKLGKQRQRGPSSAHVGDDRSDAQIRVDFEATQKKEQYQSLLEARMNLPAWRAKSEFLQAFKANRVVVCVGETGSGKTTQVPQYILDDYLATPMAPDAPSLSRLQIIVTQPRRVAALSVASRVSAERGDDGSVGYTIRGESNASRRTKILFCTTGVVLRRLTVGNGLEGVRVVVVDEVHERSVDSDFLLLELREILKKDKLLKVVLMSATINQKTFVDYFGGAALVAIPGRTFPVRDSYLEDIIPRISYSPSFTRPAQKQSEDQLRSFRQMYESAGLDAASVRALEAVTRAERIDYQLVTAVVAFIVTNKEPGAILIFMPGVQEIKQCIDSLKSSARLGPTEIFPLHANLSSAEQKAVFRSTPRRKIVVSTNVAETSVTIDDIVYVIDTGKVKETSYDPEGGLSRLTEIWVTQAAGRQRRGRAGRTRPGECFKLYTRKQEEDMGEFPIPEILRVPLESLSLAVKAVREDEDVKLFLGKAIDPPQSAAMEKAWAVLQELGAVDENGKLTALGRHMALLPVDLRLGKMLVLAAIFGCLDPVLTIAACLSCKPLFLSPVERREEATRARMKFMTANSDLLTDAHAYDECMKALAHGRSQALRDFCDENFISYTSVRDIASLREDLSSALLSAGLISGRGAGSSTASPPHPALLKSIVAAGLYPRIARVTLPASAVKFDKVQAGTVQRAQEAREFKILDLEPLDGSGVRGQRVFLHPSSVLFGQDRWKEPFLCYFRKTVTTKPFLRDATEAPVFAILLFGGAITINQVAGGLSVGGPGGAVRVRMKAWPRIGVLVNQLRYLLDEQLGEALEGTLDVLGRGNVVLEAMLAMLTRGGEVGG
ncbi:P-loop containing nucleoside triphosphate hydrolase protein [Gautieria morchelliformis]|nr:P-loop containing nucleoside triphosphate hydrolase protein [Gautieria morchelliformis]